MPFTCHMSEHRLFFGWLAQLTGLSNQSAPVRCAVVALAAEGSRLWALYLGYERGLLEADPKEEQAERVRSLWTRQLQVPLADGADTLAAYTAWERDTRGEQGWQVPAVVQAGYAKAQHAAELRQPYEASVASGKPATADLLAAYMAYIKVEERGGDPSRVQASPAECRCCRVLLCLVGCLLRCCLPTAKRPFAHRAPACHCIVQGRPQGCHGAPTYSHGTHAISSLLP
jgi:hypothetical protein